MIVRGFDGECDNHKFYFQEPSVGVKDFISLLCFFALLGAAALSDGIMWNVRVTWNVVVGGSIPQHGPSTYLWRTRVHKPVIICSTLRVSRFFDFCHANIDE